MCSPFRLINLRALRFVRAERVKSQKSNHIKLMAVYGLGCSKCEMATMYIAGLIFGLIPAIAAVVSYATSDVFCIATASTSATGATGSTGSAVGIAYPTALGVFGITTLVIFAILAGLLLGYGAGSSTAGTLAFWVLVPACVFQVIWFVIMTIALFEQVIPFCPSMSAIFAVGVFVFVCQLLLLLVGCCCGACMLWTVGFDGFSNPCRRGGSMHCDCCD